MPPINSGILLVVGSAGKSYLCCQSINEVSTSFHLIQVSARPLPSASPSMEFEYFLQGFAFSLVLHSCLCCFPGCLRRSKGLLEQMLHNLGSAGTSAPFIVCATMTWLAAAGGSPQRCCYLVKTVALGCSDFCSCYRVVFLVLWLPQVMFPLPDSYLPCGLSNSSFCHIYQRHRNCYTLTSGMVV